MAWVEQSGNGSWRVRYRRDDDPIGSIPGFATEKEAQEHADGMETDQRRGSWIDPAAGAITVAAWITEWFDAIDVATRTEDYYRSLLTNHIIPRWGDTALTDMSGTKVAAWAKQLQRAGYSHSTVSGILKLLTLIMGDAVDERKIVANPIRTRRRGRGQHRVVEEKVWGTPAEVLAVADNAALLPGGGAEAAMLLVTAGWTGARWGELTGLQRPNLHLDLDGRTGFMVVDRRFGALHESSQGLYLGPPKTAESVREISLPSFLVDLLGHHLTTHDHPHVFVTPDRQLYRRSNFARRAMRPAADGTAHRPGARVKLSAAKPGLTPHGLRHSHKTWMIADDVPEIAQSRRLGHILDNTIRRVYSHVEREVEHRLLVGLEERWTKAIVNSDTDASWRTS